MGIELKDSALMMEIQKIMKEEGSPFLRLNAIIHAGGKDIVPIQIPRRDVGGDFRTDYMDEHSIVLTVGLGTLMNDIAPFQDDIKITLNTTALNTDGDQITTRPVATRTYRAYIADHIPTALESGNNPIMQDKETADRSKFTNVRFSLEEVAIEQLRKISTGTIGRECPPYTVAETLLKVFSQSLKLAEDEALDNVDFVEANNQEPRDHVIIPDGTPLLEIPDLVQNEQGGIYSTALGFYIKGRNIHCWPLYDMWRQQSAKRLLQVFLSPSRMANNLDRTWADYGRKISVWTSTGLKVYDNTLGELNTKGNAVRFADTRKLLEGFGTVSDNKLTMSRSDNNNEFASVVVGNGQNFAVAADKHTSNIFLEASKISKRAGVVMGVLWRRSNPDIITPGMAVEVYYDYRGSIRTIEGTLIGSYSTIGLDGHGVVANRHISVTNLILFLDRNDPDFLNYLQSGGTTSQAPDSSPV